MDSSAVEPGAPKLTSTCVAVPYPPADLNPNVKVHWRRKHRAFKKYKSDVFYLIKAARLSGAHVHVTFRPATNRKRDKDNCIGAFKAGQDGIALALGVDDSELHVSHALGPVMEGGAVVIEILERSFPNEG